MGDPSRRRGKLGCKPGVGFQELVAFMVEHDLDWPNKKERSGGRFESTYVGLQRPSK